MSTGIGLSALRAASEAIDATSNNIANAQTVGYKAGQYVFQDQFFRATDPQNPNRTGMGIGVSQIRRPQTNGTIVSTSNPLDLAIGGIGMFTTAKSLDSNSKPIDFQYTRNGQYGVDNQNRIINENGNYLVGYPANPDGTINTATSSLLTLSQAPLPGAQTRNSTVAINLDDSQSAIPTTPFSPLNPATYSQSTSQVIYDTTGVSHTLSLYYQKNTSVPLTITPAVVPPVMGQSATFNYSATQASTGAALNQAQVATTASSGTQQLQNTTISQISPTGSTYLMTLSDKSTLTVTGLDINGQPTSTVANIKTFSVNTSRYSVYATLDGNPVPGPVGKTPAQGYPVGDSNSYAINSVAQSALGTMAFVGGRNIDSLGGLAGGAKSTIPITATTAGATPNNVAFNIDSSLNSAYAGSTQTITNGQDGAPLSQLSSYSFDPNGKLVAVYSNGQSVVKGQVKLANFNNDEGLIPIGGNSFEQSAISGQPTYGTANNGIFGGLKSQALEQSNVDLTSQLVTLMSLQRQYSASSQVVKTSTSLMDDILNKLS